MEVSAHSRTSCGKIISDPNADDGRNETKMVLFEPDSVLMISVYSVDFWAADLHIPRKKDADFSISVLFRLLNVEEIPLTAVSGLGLRPKNQPAF